MALGNANENDGLKTRLLRLRSKDGLRFDIIEKGEDGKYNVEGTETRVTGLFNWVKIKNITTGSGEEMTKVNIFLKDEEAGEKYMIDISPSTSLGRSVMNTLLAFEDNGKEVEISLYEKNGFNNISIRQWGELCSWKYQFAELPSPNEFTVKGKVQKDYFDAETKLLSELREKFEEAEPKKEVGVTLDDVPDF